MNYLSLIAMVALLTCAGLVQAGEVSRNSSLDDSLLRLQQHKWAHGAKDCSLDEDPAIEVFRYNQSTYILRQNKCLSFEAPFMYLFIGEKESLLLDTGAAASAEDFPLYETLNALIGESTERSKRKLLVIHSHGHGDHYAGDFQFEEMPGVTLVKPSGEAIAEYFNFMDWPTKEASIDLGGRKITIIPTPGHQEEAITIYDAQTKWLLTGDTIYPGLIYVKDWKDYRQSIARLDSFSASHEVSAVLGAHIEMTNNPGEYYPIGSTYQPEEASLLLTLKDLLALNQALQRSTKETKITRDEYVVMPMNTFPKILSNLARWLSR